MPRPLLRAASLAVLALLTGCSLLSPMAPMAAWEAVKYGGNAAMAAQPPRPINTVHHGDAPVPSVCVEYNRELPLDELVPALQAELRTQGRRWRPPGWTASPRWRNATRR